MSQQQYDLRYRNNTLECSKVRIGIVMIFTLCLCSNIYAQASQHELESRRQKLLLDIQKTDKKLAKTKLQKAGALEEYLALQSQLKVRQKLVNTLSDEVKILERDIEQTKEAIAALNEDEKRLQQEYSKMVKVAYRQKMTGNTLLFILSANGFNDAMRRWRYINQYEAYREKQAKMIDETKEVLAFKIEKLEKDRLAKEKALRLEQKQKVQLNSEKAQKNRLVKQLKSNEIALVQELDEQRLRKEELQKAIEGIILAETRRAKKNRRTEDASKETEVFFGDLAANFANSKGRHNWPVSGGKVVKGFGKHTHPKYKNVVTQNNGIDIESGSGAEVRSIFKGRVSHRQFVPGSKNMVIVSHENFYTVYANLETVSVGRDQAVNKGDVIGRLGKSKSVLHFEIWQEQTRLNPSEWIKRK